jgi:ubiquinone/menaquinone biosynthesis C-methylase UbiE
MIYNYEKFLKNKRKNQKDLKNLYRNEAKVEKYWQELGEHIMSDEEFQKWKDKLLYDHTWQTNMEAIIDYGKLTDDEKILDVGCGWGRILIGLKKYLPHSFLVGTDVIEGLLKKAQEVIKEEVGNLDNMELLISDINKLSFDDNFFDKVICIRVLQYVSKPVETLKKLKRITKKGGRVIIIVPNKLNLRQALRYHTKLYRPSEVYNWFKRSNFSQIKIGTIRFLPRFRHKPRRGSRIRIVEKIGSTTPLINKLGGLIICSGKK